MKESISKNKAWQIVGVAVLCAVCVLGAVLGIVFGMNHSSEELSVSKDMSHKPDDSVIIETQGEYGISLLYGNATTADDGSTTRTITATVSPADADNKAVNWSVAFKNASSTWATGKNVSNYVTVTPESDGALTATVTCIQAFGEQVVITCASRESEDISATATVDYEKKVVDLTCQLQRKTASTEYSNVDVIDMSDGYTYRCVVSPVYSAYTIDKTYIDDSTYGLYYGEGSFYSFVKNGSYAFTNLSQELSHTNTNTFQTSVSAIYKMLTDSSLSGGAMGNKAKNDLKKALDECGSSNKFFQVDGRYGTVRKSFVYSIGTVDYTVSVTNVALDNTGFIF